RISEPLEDRLRSLAVDQVALHGVCPLVDHGHPTVTIDPRDPIFVEHRAPTVELHAAFCTLDGGFGRICLCKCGPVARILLICHLVGGAPVECPRALELHQHIREV